MKTLITVFSVLGLAGFAAWIMFGSELGSVIDTAVSRTREQVGVNLGEEFRLDQAENALEQAGTEILRQERRVAELRVGCEDLQEVVQTLVSNCSQERRNFTALDDAWSRTGDGIRPVAFRSQLVEADDLRYELEQSAFKIKSANQQLTVRRKLLETRTAARNQSQNYLDKIRKRRDRVQLKIETSRIDLESVRLLQQAIGLDVEASALASAEEMANTVSRELRVQREIAHIGSTGRVPFDTGMGDTGPAATVQEIRSLLRGNTAPALPQHDDLALRN